MREVATNPIVLILMMLAIYRFSLFYACAAAARWPTR